MNWTVICVIFNFDTKFHDSGAYSRYMLDLMEWYLNFIVGSIIKKYNINTIQLSFKCKRPFFLLCICSHNILNKNQNVTKAFGTDSKGNWKFSSGIYETSRWFDLRHNELCQFLKEITVGYHHTLMSHKNTPKLINYRIMVLQRSGQQIILHQT